MTACIRGIGILVALAVALLVVPATSWAFQIKKVPVASPADHLVEPRTEFSAGQPLKFGVRQTASALDFRKGDFQVRVFRLESNGAGNGDVEMPTEWAEISDCLVFLSIVYRVKGKDSGVIQLWTLDEKWLTPDPARDGGMKPGRFLLVFEKINDQNSVFRIHKDSAQRYFRNGIVVVVNPIRGYSEDQVQSAYDKLRKTQKGFKNEVYSEAPKKPCYQYQAMPISAGGLPENADAMTLDTCPDAAIAQPSGAASLPSPPSS